MKQDVLGSLRRCTNCICRREDGATTSQEGLDRKRETLGQGTYQHSQTWEPKLSISSAWIE